MASHLNLALSSGIFKFSDRIDRDALVEFLKENWVSDQRFTYLYVRGCDGDRKLGIGFEYKHKGRDDYIAFVDGAIGRLKRIFGDDFVGWDVCSSTYVVKK